MLWKRSSGSVTGELRHVATEIWRGHSVVTLYPSKFKDAPPNTRLTLTTTTSFSTRAMPKRRAAPNDDSDGYPSSSAKRARTEEGSDDEVEDVPPTQTQNRTRVRRAGKGKQRAIDVDVDVDVELDGEEEDIDDEEQEQELQRVRQGRRSTGNTTTQGSEGEEEEEDEQFEAKNGDKIRAKLESKRHVQGVSPLCLSFASSVMLTFYAQGVAEYGIIEYIEMHQFMCHKYLTFHFGPQINFIIGLFFSFMSC
jgi:hypothetical protein